MASPKSFWQLLETRPSRAAVMAEWRAAADGSLSVVQSLLTPLERLATVYPNPRPGCRPMRVVRHGDGTVVAIDECDHQNRLLLGHEDIVLHQIDLRKLRQALAGALDAVRISRTPLDESGATVQVGTWEPKKAASFPVYLLLSSRPGRLREELLALASRGAKSGAILLTPTRACWSGDFEALARRWQMLPVPLCEVLEPTPDGFTATEAWEEYLQAFCQMVKLTLPGNYRNKKPVPMRGRRAANIEELEREMERHILAARDHIHTLIGRDLEPVLLPRPEQQDLAKRCGLTASDVSRCLNDRRAQLLNLLWNTADSLEQVMKFKRRR